MTSLFKQVTKYTPAGLDPAENRLTEVFAAVLERAPDLARSLIEQWTSVAVPPLASCTVTTQRPTAGGGFIDLELLFRVDGVPTVIAWIEVKHGAELRDQQLEGYQRDIALTGVPDQRLILLAPRQSMPRTELAIPSVAWQEVSAHARLWHRDNRLDPVPLWLVEELVHYLKEEGLSDPEPLNAAAAFELSARPASDRTVSALLQLTAERVQADWAVPITMTRSFAARPFWANYPRAKSAATDPPEWRKTHFEWTLRADTFRPNPRDGYVFFAGATFESNDNPTKIAGNTAWLRDLTADGFEHFSDDGWWRLCNSLYPEQLLTEDTLDGQSRILSDWVIRTFDHLARTPPQS